MVLSIPSAFAVSKSQSKYTGDALMSAESDRMGFNLHWAQKCNFSGVFSINNFFKSTATKSMVEIGFFINLFIIFDRIFIFNSFL